jgi:maltooligosyltrehalose trehalohydrolase
MSLSKKMNKTGSCSATGRRSGATYLGEERCRFSVWAPRAAAVEVRIVTPEERIIPLRNGGNGYHETIAEEVKPGCRYFYRLDGKMERPDPASKSQPRGVHGPSEVIDPSFEWDDDLWLGIRLEDYILYEIHVGTFTPDGTLEAIVPQLNRLKDLGVTAIELMPVAQFPGNRNWGYDGTYPFAIHNSYGGSAALKRLVNACHRHGLAVVLDVVYNHLGPEGNYFADFAPYFTDRHKTPWGDAVNFDGPDSDEVRLFFIENALYWITEFHMDALRLDAVHAIFDFSACTFLEDLANAVRKREDRQNNWVYLFAESAQNNARLVYASERGGIGMDSLWNDDFHHALHSLLTGESGGYYQDFGRLDQLVKAYKEGFVYSGEYSAYRRRRHGIPSTKVPGHGMVVFAQNHDQIGNRMMGERLTKLVSFDDIKLAAGAVLLSPYLPLLFMGEEYGETAPFHYFISHSDPNLIKAVQRGRIEEFAAFTKHEKPPDPQSVSTFQECILNLHQHLGRHHQVLHSFYRELIGLRKQLTSRGLLCRDRMEIFDLQKEVVFWVRYCNDQSEVIAAFNFGESGILLTLPLDIMRWQGLFDSSEQCWCAPGTSECSQSELFENGGIRIGARAFAVIEKGNQA